MTLSSAFEVGPCRRARGIPMGEQSADREWGFKSEAFAGNVKERSERTCAVCAPHTVRAG